MREITIEKRDMDLACDEYHKMCATVPESTVALCKTCVVFQALKRQDVNVVEVGSDYFIYLDNNNKRCFGDLPMKIWKITTLAPTEWEDLQLPVKFLVNI